MRRGLTLVEVIVVIFIVLLMAGLLFPVIASARLSAKKSACISNLHQASIALLMYAETNGDFPIGIMPKGGVITQDKLIRTYSPATPNASGKSYIFRCPLDTPGGRKGLPMFDRSEPVSYLGLWNLWEGLNGSAAWKTLNQVDTNPTILRCYFHDSETRKVLLAEPTVYFGLGLGYSNSLKKDGSTSYEAPPPLSIVQREDGTPTSDVKSLYWYSATKAECPPTICDGQQPDEGVRQR
jgi:prepilin-type N-terminal cleavage/methylation domain-containing protein